jgi:hypothetical protein
MVRVSMVQIQSSKPGAILRMMVQDELKAQAPAAPEEVLVAVETLNGHRDFVLNTVQCN